VITRSECFWVLNSCDWDTLSNRLDELAALIDLGDLYFDSDYNLHATSQGKAKLLVLPSATA
jgi:hypothetical protein